MKVIIDKDFLSDKNKKFIEEIIVGGELPFYLTQKTTIHDTNKHLSHHFIKRPESKEEGEDLLNSPWAEEAIDIFRSFIIHNRINCEEILRCACNLTFKVLKKSCPIHLDHEYDHKQLLIYLNDCADKTASTVLLDQKGKKILHKIQPEKYKGICFDSCPHYMIFPKKDVRLVLVYTFR